ncbi:hypothetical protein AMJ82_09490 [candidate division TA06 bacterium SM23_40]|uniref:Uncharacterized protein n=1 Tax=candidate division TA06 bacterium SM23_40 TaxID=1703774 RepID=A0A0S8G535_UNCT6|nr:MAG: hypothetical protein AMJ82_09490 [candidate division TA06 bacterium SM23_40]
MANLPTDPVAETPVAGTSAGSEGYRPLFNGGNRLRGTSWAQKVIDLSSTVAIASRGRQQAQKVIDLSSIGKM